MPVYNNDFSMNYSTSFRIKKESTANDEINSFINSKKDNNNINNNNQKNNNVEIKINQIEDNKDKSMHKQLLKEEEQPSKLETEISTLKPLYDSTRDHLDILKEENESEIIEILIKIRQKGTLKSVIFISNIYIYNNLQIPISLSLISEKDYVEKYRFNEENISFEENKNNIIINTAQKRSIPLKYLIEKYRIYISFHNKLNEEKNKYTLLFKNFDNLKENLKDFIKYDEAKNIKIGEDIDDNDINNKEIKLYDNYSQLITLQANKKDFYISSNLMIQRGINDIIKGFPTELNNAINYDKDKNELENALEANK